MTSRPSPSGRATAVLEQHRKPSGRFGRFNAWLMNLRHAKLTAWGLTRVSVRPADVILDVGCGGGATIRKLSALAPNGKVYGLDYSEDSLRVARRTNAPAIAQGHVEFRQGSVSQLPFDDATFDLVTAVETHFWWPDLANDVREVRRVLKPGGVFTIVSEVYKGGKHGRLVGKLTELTGMTILSVDEHKQLLSDAGYADVDIAVVPERGWISVTARRPA